MQSATRIVVCGTIAKFVTDNWIDVQFAGHACLALPLHGRQSVRPSSSGVAQTDDPRLAAAVMMAIRIALLQTALALTAAKQPTFYRDVLPILQQHCQNCHRPGERAPMPLETYQQVRSWAVEIRETTQLRKMPPWFAERTPSDACYPHFSNDPSLTRQQIDTIAAWVRAGSPSGTANDAPPPVEWTNGWNIDAPDVVFTMPQAKSIPPKGEISYQFVIIPTHFKEDRWVQMSEIRPGNRSVVHHAVAYIRTPQSKWLRKAPEGAIFGTEEIRDPELEKQALWTDDDLLLVYTPGASPDRWPEGMAKLIPAGSDIVLQMHYTASGKATMDRTSIGLVFAKQLPLKRVLTLQLNKVDFIIPPGVPNYRAEVHGSMPNDALLLSLYPHLHLRGKSFEYNILEPGGRSKTLLRVAHYDSYWQLNYRLAEPIPLKAGTVLQAVATWDNSKNNPHNPDPETAVYWGGQVWEEMMVGFFDVAVDPAVNRRSFFLRRNLR